MAEIKKSYDEVVAANIIDALKNGTAPWTKPWSGADISDLAPRNGKTGKYYSGVNFVNLLIESTQRGYSDPRWLTFNQGKELDASVKKGEKSSVIKFYVFSEARDKKDKNGKVILNKNGKKEKETVKLEKPKVVYHRVFNASQFDNLEPYQKTDQRISKQFEVISDAEKILKNSGANIIHKFGDRAFYSPLADHIILPEKMQFSSEMAYYGVALHELGHWTGHESRLDRDLSGDFGSESYAKEELRAEISAFMTCSLLALDFDPSRHFSYIESWVKILEDDSKEITRASRDALKISNFVMAFGEENSDVDIKEINKNFDSIIKHYTKQEELEEME